MSRLVHRTIEVQLHHDRPIWFVDRDATHLIAMIRDWWIEESVWWDKERPRTIYQVVTSEGYMFDIERTGEGWFIYRVWD